MDQNRPSRVGPFRLLAREQVAHVIRKAKSKVPPPAPREVKAALRVLLLGHEVGSYHRRVVREEMRRAGAPFRSPPDFRQLPLFPENEG